MSENERLRQALRDMIELSMEDDSMWELHETSLRERRRAARNALAAKPEVCVWHTETIDGSPRWFSDCGLRNVGLNEFDPPSWDTPRCPGPGCGREIEVKGE